MNNPSLAMPASKEQRAERWEKYAAENREALREKGRRWYHANIVINRQRNAERMRRVNAEKRQSKLNDPDYQKMLAAREEHKALLPDRKAKWIESSKQKRKSRAQKNRSDKKPPHQRKYRRGFIRDDGMVFWRYQWDQIEQEKWVTQEYFNNRAPIEREKALSKAKTNQSKFNPERYRRWHKWKNANDPLFALKHRCRARLQAAIRLGGWKKTCKTNEMLGCNWDTLKLHIESQFTKGMSWNNRNLWHIDHFHPLSDAKTEKEVIRLSHYTNLRPLWKKENQTKSAKMPTGGHQIPLLLQ